MAAKRVDPLKAKEAKQKKIAIVLGVLFLLVVAYQGPKTLKMLKGPQAAAAPAPAPAAPTTTGAVPSAPAPTAPDSPTELVDSDVPADPDAGQLLSFEQFASKDPFKQQVDLGAVVPAASDPTAPDSGSLPGSGDAAAPDPGAEPVSPGVDPSIPGSAENPPISVGGGVGSGSSGSGSPGSGSGSAGSPPAEGPAPAANTTISVNGADQTVAVGSAFPTGEPIFELVSLGKDGRSVQIRIAGGNLASGGATLRLELGKPVTLQNTADGSRYTLVLRTIEGVPPK